MGFDWILSSQGNATEDDEDENEVGEVGVMDEVVAGNSQTEDGKKKWNVLVLKQRTQMRGRLKIIDVHLADYQFFFPRMKKELPSGIGTIFSLGPENSGFSGATPLIKIKSK